MQNLLNIVKAAADKVRTTIEADVNPANVAKDLKAGAKALEKALDVLNTAAENGAQLAHAGEVGINIAEAATASDPDPTIAKLHSAAGALKDALHVFQTAADETSKLAVGARDVLKARADTAADAAVTAATEAHDAVASIVDKVAGRDVVPKWAKLKPVAEPAPTGANLGLPMLPSVPDTAQLPGKHPRVTGGPSAVAKSA